MDAQGLRLFITGIFVVLLVGCTSAPVPVRPSAQTPSPSSAGSAQQSQPNSSAEQQPAQQPPPPALSQGASSQSSQDLIKKGEILVTKEEYKQTFDDVRQLIEELNRIIEARDYDAWTQHLTATYIKRYSDPKTLTEISNQPMLKRQNLDLTSLKDYFLNVVVPSRADARLDDLEFTSKTQVKAITVIDGRRYILYDLRFEDGSWKIGVS